MYLNETINNCNNNRCEVNESSYYGSKCVTLRWENLTYKFEVSKGKLFYRLFGGHKQSSQPHDDHHHHLLLKHQSGQISSGTLTGILGKSGSGKTTLIQCLAGRRTSGLIGGNICLGLKRDNQVKRVKLSFVPQQDHLLHSLTIEESLLFASKLKNTNSPICVHKEIVNKLIEQFDLESCRKTYNKCCSGGQRKRLSIAMELVNYPNILILDEPTTGLDSASALHCVQILRRLSENVDNPLAIMATVHQPSTEMLFTFHNLYLLSHHGQCIHFGPTPDLLQRLSEHRIPCPTFNNPADYAIEVACGEQGAEVIQAMEDSNAKWYESRRVITDNDKEWTSVTTLESMDTSFWTNLRHTMILFHRSLTISIREPTTNLFRFLVMVLMIVTTLVIFDRAIGQESGCLTEKWTMQEMITKQGLTSQNIGFLFIVLIYLSFSSMMSTVVSFPSEIQVYLKENRNGWYSTGPYFLAKTMAELPLLLLYSSVFVYIIYHITGQVESSWRLSVIVVIFLLASFIGQTYGLLYGALFCENLNAAIFIGPLVTFSGVLVCGFFAKVSTMKTYLLPLVSTSFTRYAFEALLITLYGHGRCLPLNLTNSSSLDIKNLSPLETCFGLVQSLNNFKRLNISTETLTPYLDAFAEASGATEQQLDQLDHQVSKVNRIPLETLLPTDLSNANKQIYSIVMKEFELSDEMLSSHVVMLSLILVTLLVIVYLVMRLKSRNA